MIVWRKWEWIAWPEHDKKPDQVFIFNIDWFTLELTSFSWILKYIKSKPNSGFPNWQGRVCEADSRHCFWTSGPFNWWLGHLNSPPHTSRGVNILQYIQSTLTPHILMLASAAPQTSMANLTEEQVPPLSDSQQQRGSRPQLWAIISYHSKDQEHWASGMSQMLHHTHQSADVLAQSF